MVSCMERPVGRESEFNRVGATAPEVAREFKDPRTVLRRREGDEEVGWKRDLHSHVLTLHPAAA